MSAPQPQLEPVTTSSTRGARLFAALSPGGERNLLDTLRSEKVGGVLVLVGAVVALCWANFWPGSYRDVSSTVIGPASLHLDLSIAAWAMDGLLAVFFFVVGLELKREIVAGELRRLSTAIVPMVAAVGGMAVPALISVASTSLHDGAPLSGWAVPTATDIAFAVAVLAVVGRSLPQSLRAFLLTLAVVDDLLAIVIIAVFYADGLHLWWLLAALGGAAVFAALIRLPQGPRWLALPVAVATWGFMHASGVHATIAGVLLGLTVPAMTSAAGGESIAEHLEHRWRPLSAAVAVPVFAVFAAGVTLSGSAIADAVKDPIAQGTALGLVIGKPAGILLATWLVATFTRAQLAEGLHWFDVMAVGMVAGIGFTVSLLIGQLAFGADSPHAQHATVAILLASVTAAVLGGAALAWRDRVWGRVAATSSTSAA